MSKDKELLDEFPRTPENAWLFKFRGEPEGVEFEYEDKDIFENSGIEKS